MGNDAAILIRKAAQFAAGFSFAKGDPSGQATAGTAAQISPTLGEKVRGGFSAVSPGFRAFEESRANIDRLESLSGLRQGQTALTSAQRNKVLEETRVLREEADRKKALALRPFDISKPFGVKATSEMTKATEDFFRRNNVDLDSNGVTTNEEVTKFLSSGSASERASKKKELSRIAALGTKGMQRQSQFVQVKIDEELKKLKEKFQDSSLTINDVINNPAMASDSKKLIGFLDELDSNTKRNKAFTQFQVGIQRDIDEGEKEARVPTKLDVTRSKDFDKDLSGIQDVLSESDSNEEKRELILKLIDFYKGQRNEIIQQLRLSHPEVMNELGFSNRQVEGFQEP